MNPPSNQDSAAVSAWVPNYRRPRICEPTCFRPHGAEDPSPGAGPPVRRSPAHRARSSGSAGRVQPGRLAPGGPGRGRRPQHTAPRSAPPLRTVAECCRLADDAIRATGSRLMTAVQDTLPFHDLAETPTASDWCQRWNGRRHSFRHVGEGGFDARRYAVELLPGKEAKPSWSGATTPAPSPLSSP